MGVPTAVAAVMNFLVSLGTIAQQNKTIFTFTQPTSWLASFGSSSPVALSGALDLDLAALFPGITNCYGIFVKEVTDTPVGFTVSPNATGTTCAVRAGGFWCYSPNGGVPPHLYLNGAGAYLEIGVIGS